jgi:hypothetical protein
MKKQVTSLQSGDRILLHEEQYQVVDLHINHGYGVVVLKYKCKNGHVYSSNINKLNEILMID